MPRAKTDMLFVKSVYAPGITKVQMGRYNRMKYSKKPPPSIELILKIQSKSGLSQSDFELMYGIPQNTIALVVGGHRYMPFAYWHIFYDFNNLKKIIKEVSSCIERGIKKDVLKKEKISPSIISANNLEKIKKLNRGTK